MCQSSETGSDFGIPDEILSVIPTDPYDQIDLARNITSMAIASRVSNLESEITRLWQMVYEKDKLIVKLKQQASHLQKAVLEADSRLKIVLDENLEAFKSQLMQSLSDNVSFTKTVDAETFDQSVPRAYPENDGCTIAYMKYHSLSGLTEGGRINSEDGRAIVSEKCHSFSGITEGGRISSEASRQTGQKPSMTQSHSASCLIPSASPKIISSSVSPRAFSAAGSPKNSGATSPTKLQYEEETAEWCPPSEQSSAANSPHAQLWPGLAPRVDGKKFFHLTRNRLSYEQYSAFLENIRELNQRKQSAEETLKKAEEIFGADNKDLYLSFQALLSRHPN